MGVDKDDAVRDQLWKFEKSGWLLPFDIAKQVRDHLGSDFVLNKIGAVKKIKPDGSTKTRIIVDSFQSGTTRATRRAHKSNLPTVTGAVKGILGLMSWNYSPEDGDEIELLITDVSDAFWNVPLHYSERRSFVVKFRGRLYVFLRTAQGSRGAPLSWASVASLLARVSQSLLLDQKGQEGRLQVYVDDPLLALKGQKQRRRVLAVRFISCFILLGVRLAFDKAKIGNRLTWIGMDIWVRDWCVEVQVPLEKLNDILAIVEGFLSSNVVSVRDLRSLAGKSTSIASVLYMWRPFLQQLWAALSATSQSKAPLNTVWTKQIQTALCWLRAFVKGQQGTVKRLFSYESCFGLASPLLITTDASVYGIGGWISLNGVPIAWFSDDLRDDDFSVLGHGFGDNRGQQAFESLALLVAVRTWSALWRDRRVKLALRSDNLGALSIFSAFKGAEGAMNLVAREFALEMAEGSFEQDLVSHLPVVANKTADVLSRRRDPKYAQSWAPPAFLASARRVHLAPRPRSWWKSLVTPGEYL